MADEPDRAPVADADVCIVGAGPAGGIVAHQLAESGANVVVLEAGPRFDGDRREQLERHIRPGLGNPWEMGGPRDEFSSSGESFYPLNAARVKGVGGTTLHWQGMVMRLHERDFELDSRHGVGADWPIGYDDLKPHYAEAERELGVAGAVDNPYAPSRDDPFPLPAFPPSHSDSIFAEACKRLELDMHSAPSARNSEPYDGRSSCVGFGTCKPVCPSGAKYTAESHIEKAEAAGARVIDRARVRRLEHDDSGERVVAAAYTTPDGQSHRQKAAQFVLACGGVENVRLLLLSESDRYPDGLANSSGLVGRYFMDHLFAGMGGRLDRPTRQNHVGFNTSECHQFYDDTDPVNGVKLEFLNYAGPSPVIDSLHADTWGDELLAQLDEDYGTHVSMGALVEQFPREDNYVGLDGETTDDLGDPVPDVHWSVDDQTKAALKRANEIQASVMDELGVDVEWTVGPDNTGPAFHHMGTTRMGDDPDSSVVDAECRTHDLQNLWISGSSVFPTGGAMNPTLTIAALALRLADSVRQRVA
ncbi:GMC family oxidoreductase [Haloferax mediterranei ATCC 33500]|uniref:GMC family oxidoreductase n=1 Tax=Haloferax mediterranei (strain ATCC 33500 / DSM 1411 / JCM 8866 / NBRC 14739 / NCIMB 2177 / R-4) TaxID=523841 RepID=I3R4A9_HALMT|nr:GMC family oxidoreductase [Haloferax mediterranei]AFK19069.1 oxidoreductase-like protein [Haloferax mediterranei ATCC 33500]AHZ21571.1 GMC family oxidoreductase [Haloferax mediterranei ATCC 33500]EMA04034.1 oxidoreductase-like protein [Haloferax mediterranei ATCC 33500]MDX5989161.1 GMC family oxidoreductase [Haloferax mediterranei ATCC 33500]QCQ75542.1 GMC family oxidoreductase [Haloferax mediterranei ATCC 33500]